MSGVCVHLSLQLKALPLCCCSVSRFLLFLFFVYFLLMHNMHSSRERIILLIQAIFCVFAGAKCGAYLSNAFTICILNNTNRRVAQNNCLLATPHFTYAYAYKTNQKHISIKSFTIFGLTLAFRIICRVIKVFILQVNQVKEDFNSDPSYFSGNRKRNILTKYMVTN